MSDGGITGIAWYGLDLPANTPTIVLLHTITGSPESMRELVRDLHKYTGWRVALCLRRGHAHLPMPVPKMNLLVRPKTCGNSCFISRINFLNPIFMGLAHLPVRVCLSVISVKRANRHH